MIHFAGNRYPFVIFAAPASHPPSIRHSASNSGPAARWIAPSTPPPPSKVRFAALTIASTASVVMSATQISSRTVPTSAATSGWTFAIAGRLSRPLGLRLRARVHRRLHADIVEVLVEEAP